MLKPDIFSSGSTMALNVAMQQHRKAVMMTCVRIKWKYIPVLHGGFVIEQLRLAVLHHNFLIT